MSEHLTDEEILEIQEQGATDDWGGGPARKAKAKASGKLRGIGVSCYIEACGIARRKASRGKTPGGATARRKAAGSEAADGETTNDTDW